MKGNLSKILFYYHYEIIIIIYYHCHQFCRFLHFDASVKFVIKSLTCRVGELSCPRTQ